LSLRLPIYRRATLLVFFLGTLMTLNQAFVVVPLAGTTSTRDFLQAHPNPALFEALSSSQPQSVSMDASSSVVVSAMTVDPTTFLNDALSSTIGTPLILAVPIVAALGVAFAIAFFIFSYATPAEPDATDDE